MTSNRRIFFRAVLFTAMAVGIFITAAKAQPISDYPARPVRIIVPYPPAGATDIVARIVSQRLGEKWGRTVLVENRAGAGGNIGTELAAKSAPDGYTLVVGATSNIGTNVSLYEKLGFDPVRDFSPITLVTTSPQVIVVRPALGVGTLQELITLAKNKPGVLNYSSYGNGSLAHLTTELLKTTAGIDMVHIPYKGGSPAMTAVIAGEVQLTIATISVALGQVKAGKVRPLAVTSSKRFGAMPDTPTFAEAGLVGFEAESWVALLAPAGTPPAIIRKVSEDVAALVATPEMKQFLADQGLVPVGSSPEKLREFIKSEIDRWAKVVKVSGARAEP